MLLALKHWDSRRVRWLCLGVDALIALAILGFVAFAPARPGEHKQKWYQFGVHDILRWILILSVLFKFPWTSVPAVDAAWTVALGVVLCGMVMAGALYLRMLIVSRRT
jgi:hypothetical protein